MGSQLGIMSVAACYGACHLAGVTMPTWAMLLVYMIAGWIPQLFPDKSVGAEAPPLDETVRMLQGQRPKIGSPGRVAVVERWATWCPPCVASIPHLNGLYEKYKDKVDMVGVTDESDEMKIKGFMAKHGMKYPVAIDTNGVVSKGYPSNGIPNATIIGTNGRVYWKGHPMAMDTHLEAAVNGAVASNSK